MQLQPSISQATISTWGKSTAVRIPAALVKASGLRIGQTVQFEPLAGGGITLRPVRERLDLDALLAAVTAANLPDEAEVTWGKPAGTEAW
jgi:antitoxin component of MazEF toxin-antitoxin module